MQSSSNGRRRLEHYSSQRAQDVRDALPLLVQQTDPRRQSSRPASYFPTSPEPSHQPHQLIAVCFNHMAGRECDHCRNLDRSLNERRSDGSPDSHHTLGYHSQRNSNQSLGQHSQRNGGQRHSNTSLVDEKQQDSGEKGAKPGPPPVVGFWDARLGKLRLQMLGLWGRTSKQASPVRYTEFALTLW